VLFRSLATPCVMTSSAIIRRSTLGDLRFDETTGHSEDLILFSDLWLKGSWRLVDEALVAKRTRPGQATGTHWHRIWAVETRIHWLREHADEVGRARALEIEHAQVRGLAGFLESIYWRRELKDLKAMRNRAMALCPEVFKDTFIAKTRILPGWAYKLRDALSAHK